MKDNDPLKHSSEIKAINHEIEPSGVKVDMQLTNFLNALYPSYSNCLESLQASGQVRDLDFDKLVGKIAEREKAFGNKETSHNYNTETLCLAQKYQKPQEEYEISTKSNIGRGRKNYRGKGVEIFMEIDNRMINKEIFPVKQL